jgi:PncC family amidohydrolase
MNEYILSTENIPSSKVLLDLLHEKELSISLVESVTGGNLASSLVNHPGASKALVASNILYTAESKKEFLSSDPIDDWSLLTEDLAKASKIKYNSNISLAILGEAGPIPSSNYKIGQVFVSIVTDANTEAIEHNLRGSRDDIINRSVNNAIWDLIKFIKKL